ncbi:hypothetical protein [Burkholderia glumae]|uniref:hypothetical protein n=1 Tax=Burkholderia glumae TaxID=337 RepID=UPI0020374727|nr:hypothetical protein [Burkholderia glumae]MCM2537951.1 hypothetical protein [Burkholderia glumae]
MTDPDTTTPATLRADALELLREIAARKRYDPNAKVPWVNNSGSITINLKRELLARVDALLDAAAAAPAVEPIRLVHVALAEDGGNLRWMTGRKPRDCELYMMPDGGRAPAVVYATRSAPVAEYDGNHMQDRCCECNDYEAECRCAEPSEIEQVIACLGDDAAKLREANADDEMADNMEAAARLLSERAALSPAPVDEAAQDEQALLDEALSNHGYGHASVDERERHHFKKGFKARAAVSPATARKSCICSGLGPCERRTDGSCRVSAPAGAREHDDPAIIAASNRGYAAGLRDGKAIGACGRLASVDAGGAMAPSGYAHRYPSGSGTVIRFNDGREVNGCRPIESVPYWLGAPPAANVAAEEAPSFKSPLTHYGMLVRALRIVTGTLLGDMAKAMNVSPAFLSALELGRRPVTHDNAVFASGFFSDHGVIGTLPALTYAAAVTRLAQGTDLPDSEGGEA